MKKILFIGSLVVASLLYAQDIQNTQISQQDINTQNEMSNASTKDISPKSIEDFFEEFADKFDIEYGVSKNAKTFYTGKSTVIINDTDPQFAQALQNAYQKAMLNLQSEFVKDAFGRIATSKIQSYEADNSTNAREFEELPKGGAIKQILNKLSQLAGAKLDKALNDLGIDTKSLSEDRKKTLLKQEFLSKTITSALGSMSGLVPVQTIVTQRRGEYDVGVIAVISNKTRQLAKDMALSRKSNIKGKGKAISEYLPKDKKGFLNEYGIRLIYDENGAPVILSYGNWGYVADSSNAKKTNILEDSAKETALTMADAAIVEFINTSISLKDERTTGESYEDIIKQSINLNDNSTQVQTQNITNIIDKVNSKIKASASGKIRGIRTLKKWSYTSENGIEHVGAVRFYSYENLANANEALKPKTNTQKNEVKKSSNIQRNSNIINDIDDF
ncbi:DUF6844 domain-containing protein [Campylobacter canadensis]|uniref:DUF6844 domain-containing protein n=1 Tax=Campylobacter canadensis TaxID=449520 RepID=A0ABS7WRF9_9BACT|nr:hypothetical protein [Campylobacter canadensis]MBZ7986917.1 hypothetical protein [Campylobacter canadensis]MBZ7994239.1 hypothetical protein [Campylobacter canadensis]MBZ7995769.1 hypothetical protein [Campylobacter canadensis]MBZ7997954.1 hypothetical protein [Campylobacter canadensis]MBZ7999571.1 hypothetical protein [Campylobacter canadensis]